MDEISDSDSSEYFDFDTYTTEDSLREIFQNCIVPVVQQSFNRLLPVLCITFFMGELMRLGFTGKTANVFCFSLGIALLIFLVDPREAFVFVVVTALTYDWVRISAKYRINAAYFSFVGLSLLYLVFREHVSFFGPQPWAEVRGIAMISFMKTISLIHEVTTRERVEVPTAIEYFGYVFFPGTLPFGPWLTFVEHSNRLNHSGWSTNYCKWSMVLLWKLCCSFAYVLFSTCILTFIVQYMELESIYGHLFFDAMMVRFSHYFVCQVAEAAGLLTGPRTPEAVLNSPVVFVMAIEFPRSMVDVVVHWNMPMHRWLKIHIYNPLRSGGLDNKKAAIFTFVISALLHGLNYRLTAVLVSIGLYCYIEYTFRKALSTCINSCVQVRPCTRCGHRYRHQLLVQLVNFGFFLLAVFNLAYLGAMLDEGQGHGLERWSEVGYSSHLLMLGMLLATYLIQLLSQII